MSIPCAIGRMEFAHRSWGWAGAFLLLLHFSGLNAQGAATFEASVNMKEIVAGIPFEVNFTLKNAEGTRFSPPTFAGFQKGGISEIRGMSIVNGRSSSHQTWSLELVANKPGSYVIGPASVLADGLPLSTKPLTLNVLSVAASSKGKLAVPPGADDQVFVAAEFEPKEAFVGQQVTWRVRLYTQLSVNGYDIISIPDFEGFFTKEKIRFDKRVEYLTISGKKYAVRTLYEEALFPLETGELSVGAARLSVGIEQPGTQGFLFGPKPVRLQTQPVSLLVKPLPTPQAPTFTGGVGRYEWSVSADTTALSTDDALTLVVEIKGNGDARRFGAPNLTVPGTAEIYPPRSLEEEEYESESEILHRKKLEYVVLPKDTGLLEIIPMLTCFDPDSNRFCNLHSPPIRVTVTAGRNYRPDTNDEAPTVADNPAPGSPWYTWGAPWSWGILALPLLWFSWKRASDKPAAPAAQAAPRSQSPAPEKHPQQHRQHNLAASRQRLTALGDALKAGADPQQFYPELFKALQAWLSARFGLQPAQMNEADLRAVLLQRGATPIRTQALLSVWHSCEQAIYGAQAQADQMMPVWQLAVQVVEALEREVF